MTLLKIVSVIICTIEKEKEKEKNLNYLFIESNILIWVYNFTDKLYYSSILHGHDKHLEMRNVFMRNY